MLLIHSTTFKKKQLHKHGTGEKIIAIAFGQKKIAFFVGGKFHK